MKLRRYALLILWILGIAFPMALFGRFSSSYGRAFDTIFHDLWVHILAHAFLFAVLAYLLARTLQHRLSPAAVAVSVLALVLAVGLVQEGLQLWYKARLPGPDELLDLGVDLTGAGLGLIGTRLTRRRGSL